MFVWVNIETYDRQHASDLQVMLNSTRVDKEGKKRLNKSSPQKQGHVPLRGGGGERLVGDPGSKFRSGREEKKGENARRSKKGRA